MKQQIVRWLRHLRLLAAADYGRYWLDRYRRRATNRAFVGQHPDFALPPKALAYDAYGHTDSAVYYFSGREHARFLGELIRTHSTERPLRICEWGCGPGRIIRHLGEQFAGIEVELFGTDYNSASIEWCADHIKGIEFRRNQLSPPLPFGADYFDCMYALSVFTHLSEPMHFRWIQELSRVVAKDGLIIFTTHGNTFRSRLLDRERRSFDNGEIVVRGHITEGKRCFVAYHPTAFVRGHLLVGLSVVSHMTAGAMHAFEQDVWVVRNTKNADSSLVCG